MRPLCAMRLLWLLPFVTALLAQRTSYIDNTAPRRDAHGALMDVHDGNVAQWQPDGLFHWYGMGYRDCPLRHVLLPPQDCPGIWVPVSQNPCGFRLDHAVQLYTSPDLVEWTYRGDVLPPAVRPEGIYFRPKVIYNALTRQYVLWVNHLPASAANGTIPLWAYPKAGYVVATSGSPLGPFTVRSAAANTRYTGGGDFGILVDGPDAFLAYSAWQNNHKISIERLNPTFTDTTGESSGLLTEALNEAPVLLKFRGWYYLLYGVCCCFCREGSGVKVHVSRHPLGPYRDTGLNVGWRDGASLTRSQQNAVFTVNVVGGIVMVWTGDQWGTAPDGLKSHDRQYWAPLTWNMTADPPMIEPFVALDGFALRLSSGTGHRRWDWGWGAGGGRGG